MMVPKSPKVAQRAKIRRSRDYILLGPGGIGRAKSPKLLYACSNPHENPSATTMRVVVKLMVPIIIST